MRTLNKKTLERMEAYIQKYCVEKGVSPSYRNIMHGIGMTSLNLVVELMKAKAAFQVLYFPTLEMRRRIYKEVFG